MSVCEKDGSGGNVYFGVEGEVWSGRWRVERVL